MPFDPRLTAEAAALIRPHASMLARLPATFHASVLVELGKWPTLFGAERAYQAALLRHLASLSADERQRIFAALAGVEAQAGCDRLAARDPARYQDEAQALLRARRLLTPWRQAVDAVFQAVQPAIDRDLHPPDGPRRLVVQIYGTGIGVRTEQLWSRLRTQGVRVPLALDGIRGPAAFLGALFGGAGADVGRASTLFAAVTGAPGASPLDAWVIEAGSGFHAAGDAPAPAATAATASAATDALTSLSYERLREYRDELTRALYEKIQAGVESPQAFAAYARSLRIAPKPGVLRHGVDVVQAFVRDLFLTGNGTLFVNNTFVEWAAVQALRRAQPRLLVARYGVRDKMKPFSSLLLFSRPRATDQIPEIEDPTGSFVDVEQLSHYVWLNAGKSAAYRQNTLHLLLAEGVDEMLAIRSTPVAPGALPAAVPLRDVGATMAAWLGVPPPDPAGTPIAGLIAVG